MSEHASITLPTGFPGAIRSLLGAEADAFFESLTQPRRRGIRLNPSKITRAELEALLGFELAPLPWCRDGFLLPEDSPTGLGRNPAHLAGLFYLQDPAAMSVVPAMGLAPESRVADLTAAPGGKSTQLLDIVGQHGLLVASEISSKRYRILIENLDGWGAHSWMAHEGPFEQLLGKMIEPFDAVLVDAPCSGEALFRRDSRAMREWSLNAVAGAARRQVRMLDAAAQMVRENGVLVYSTCTFGRSENEDVVADFLDAHDGWELEALPVEGLSPGFPSSRPTELTGRLWPHRSAGEGQFVARMRNLHEGPSVEQSTARSPRGHRNGRGGSRGDDSRALRAWSEFQRDVVPGVTLDPSRLVAVGDRVYHRPAAEANVTPSALRRPGAFLGVAKPGRFEPSHALAAMVDCSTVSRTERWEADDPRLQSYIAGDAIREPGPNGWVLVCLGRWPLGWAKRSSGVLKNFFPRYLRLQATHGPPVVAQ